LRLRDLERRRRDAERFSLRAPDLLEFDLRFLAELPRRRRCLDSVCRDALRRLLFLAPRREVFRFELRESRRRLLLLDFLLRLLLSPLTRDLFLRRTVFFSVPLGSSNFFSPALFFGELESSGDFVAELSPLDEEPPSESLCSPSPVPEAVIESRPALESRRFGFDALPESSFLSVAAPRSFDAESRRDLERLLFLEPLRFVGERRLFESLLFDFLVRELFEPLLLRSVLFLDDDDDDLRVFFCLLFGEVEFPFPISSVVLL